MNTFIRALSVVLFAAVLTENRATAAEPGGPSVRALMLTPSGAFADFHPLSGEKVGKAVLIGASGLSDTFKPGTRAFSLAVPDATKDSGYRAVANVLLPEEGKHFIILLEPTGDTYKVHVVNGKEARFGADGLLLFNSTKSTIGAILGSEKIIIKPRVPVFAKPPQRDVKPYYQVAFYKQHEDGARLFANTRWPYRDSSRCYVFFYQNTAEYITYQAVDEELTPESPTE